MKLRKRGEGGKRLTEYLVWIILSIIVAGALFIMINSLKNRVLP